MDPSSPSPSGTPGALLDVKDLQVDFRSEDGRVHAVRGVDLVVEPGKVLAVVGESGSGKSVTAMSILGLLPSSAEVTGSIRFEGEELLEASPTRLRQVRGAEIAMIFQDPLTALNPVYRVGDQIVEMIRAHSDVSKRAARARAVEMLAEVGIPQPDKRARQYPHEFSGGMRQRAMIAMALACDPKLIIADEPTTALDVTVQAQVLELLSSLSERLGTAIVLITHDLGVVAGMADRVVVMYAGRLVEKGTVDDVFDATAHPYTAGLLASLPRLDRDVDEPLVPIGGQPPSMLRPPPGCSFHPRCRFADEIDGCTSVVPPLVEFGVEHVSACHRAPVLVPEGALARLAASPGTVSTPQATGVAPTPGLVEASGPSTPGTVEP